MTARLPDSDGLRTDYAVVLADPPWTFMTRSDKGKGRSAENHYGCMSLDEIKALPVAAHCGPNASLVLWVTDPCLKQGLEVMEAWGFRYVTVGFTWVKLNRCAPVRWLVGVIAYTLGDFFTGMGYWTRSNPEMALLGTRGSPKRLHKDVRQLIIARRREHSRKPDATHVRIQRLLAGPYLELFAREPRNGWDSWGNQTEKFTPAPVNCIDNSVNMVHKQG